MACYSCRCCGVCEYIPSIDDRLWNCWTIKWFHINRASVSYVTFSDAIVYRASFRFDAFYSESLFTHQTNKKMCLILRYSVTPHWNVAKSHFPLDSTSNSQLARCVRTIILPLFDIRFTNALYRVYRVPNIALEFLESATFSANAIVSTENDISFTIYATIMWRWLWHHLYSHKMRIHCVFAINWRFGTNLFAT